jgi:hypothetical protein
VWFDLRTRGVSVVELLLLLLLQQQQLWAGVGVLRTARRAVSFLYRLRVSLCMPVQTLPPGFEGGQQRPCGCVLDGRLLHHSSAFAQHKVCRFHLPKSKQQLRAFPHVVDETGT